MSQEKQNFLEKKTTAESQNSAWTTPNPIHAFIPGNTFIYNFAPYQMLPQLLVNVDPQLQNQIQNLQEQLKSAYSLNENLKQQNEELNRLNTECANYIFLLQNECKNLKEKLEEQQKHTEIEEQQKEKIRELTKEIKNLRQQNGCLRISHAEQSAHLTMAKNGIQFLVSPSVTDPKETDEPKRPTDDSFVVQIAKRQKSSGADVFNPDAFLNPDFFPNNSATEERKR